MKRILLFTLLISFIGYSQNPIQPNHQNFNNGLPQDLVEKMNSVNFELGNDDTIDFNPIQRVSGMKPQSFQSEMMIEQDDISYLLTKEDYITFDQNGIQHKDINEFDNDGYLILNMDFNWDGSFIPTIKEERTYFNDIVTEYKRYEWNSDLEIFYIDYKYNGTFNDNGYILTSEDFRWNFDLESLLPSNKSEYEYYDDGSFKLINNFYWDIYSESYLLSNYNEFIRNDKVEINLYYNKNNQEEVFKPVNKTEGFYNENGTTKISHQYNYNQELDFFTPISNHKLQYDEFNREISNSYFTIDSCNITETKKSENMNSYNEETRIFSGKWYDSNLSGGIIYEFEQIIHNEFGLIGDEFKVHETYNPEQSNRKSLKEFNDFGITNSKNYKWSVQTSSFYVTQLDEFTYDENGNQILHVTSKRNSENETLVVESRETRTYDGSFTPFELTEKVVEKYNPGYGYTPKYKMNYSIHSDSETEIVIKGILSEYDSIYNTWNELLDEVYVSYWYYTKTSSLSTNSVEPNLFSIYPNPTSNTLQINSSESLSNPLFELYDVKGSKILSNPFKLTEPIDVSDLQPSMYIYNVKDGSELKQSGKVLIE